MIRYIESFYIFKAVARMCGYSLSAEQVETDLIKILKDLHYSYLHDKVKSGISFTLSSNLFMIAIREAVDKKDKAEIHYNIALAFVEHLMEKHRDDVVLHFQSNHPEECNYCDLLKSTIFLEMVNAEKGNEQIEEKKSPQLIIVHEYKDAKNIQSKQKGKPKRKKKERPTSFGCTLTKAQKKALVEFINLCNINFQEITLQDIEDFLKCKEGFYIRPRVNSHAAFILGRLHKEGFINNKWASLTGECGLLHSSQDADSSLTAHNITQMYSKVWKKGIKFFSPEERRIYDFIQGLKNIK